MRRQQRVEQASAPRPQARPRRGGQRPPSRRRAARRTPPKRASPSRADLPAPGPPPRRGIRAWPPPPPRCGHRGGGRRPRRPRRRVVRRSARSGSPAARQASMPPSSTRDRRRRQAAQFRDRQPRHRLVLGGEHHAAPVGGEGRERRQARPHAPARAGDVRRRGSPGSAKGAPPRRRPSASSADELGRRDGLDRHAARFRAAGGRGVPRSARSSGRAART